MTICMTNGGHYCNVISINHQPVAEFSATDLESILTRYAFILITFKSLEEQCALVRTSCISSITFDS